MSSTTEASLQLFVVELLQRTALGCGKKGGLEVRGLQAEPHVGAVLCSH